MNLYIFLQWATHELDLCPHVIYQKRKRAHLIDCVLYAMNTRKGKRFRNIFYRDKLNRCIPGRINIIYICYKTINSYFEQNNFAEI